MSRREEDVATEMFVINSHDYVMFFTSTGRVYRLKCYEIPELQNLQGNEYRQSAAHHR